jgi:hypothetical protein
MTDWVDGLTHLKRLSWENQSVNVAWMGAFAWGDREYLSAIGEDEIDWGWCEK